MFGRVPLRRLIRHTQDRLQAGSVSRIGATLRSYHDAVVTRTRAVSDLHSLTHRLRAEGREQRTEDRAVLPDAERGDVQFRPTPARYENVVATDDFDAVEHSSELVRRCLENSAKVIVVGGALGADEPECRCAGARPGGVAGHCFSCNIEHATRSGAVGDLAWAIAPGSSLSQSYMSVSSALRSAPRAFDRHQRVP